MLALLQLTESPSPSQVLGKKGRAPRAPVVFCFQSLWSNESCLGPELGFPQRVIPQKNCEKVS